MSKDAPDTKKRSFSTSNCSELEVQSIEGHCLIKRSTCINCRAYKGERFNNLKRPRAPLAQIAANQGQESKRRTSIYGCNVCDLALCNNGSCFDIYYRI
jgi:hypothetical protein